MKKTTLSLLLTLFISSGICAQHAISVGPQMGLPSNFRSSTKLGFGGSIEYDTKIAEHFGIRGSVGYNYFKGKLVGDHVSFLPIRAGVQGYLTPDLFVLGEAGPAIYGDSNDQSKTRFSFALGAGSRVPLKPRQFIQLSLSYNYFNSNFVNYTWFNLRAAFGLAWHR